jgi:Zn-dependent peptidase ImmA (M78 family)/DNA-binding XRE family transcriptional regulator
MNPVVASRIRSARLLRGLSLHDVAELLGVSRQMVHKYEQGVSIPPSDKLIQLGRIFQVKPDYFFQPFEVEIGPISFRKRSIFSTRRQEALKVMIRLALENYLYVENVLAIDYSFRNPIDSLQVRSAEDVVNAVRYLRDAWRIGDDPVHNIIQLLEDQEIKVVEVEDVSDSFDGLATFVNDRFPVIVVNAGFPIERKRFTLLHELGHLLMNLPPDTKPQEALCNQFAGEFLFPLTMVRKELGPSRHAVLLEELYAMQEKYGLSVQAIMYRLVDAGVMPETKLSSFYKQIRANPALQDYVDASRFATPERSDRFQQLVLRALSQESISLSKASALLNRSVADLKRAKAI